MSNHTDIQKQLSAYCGGDLDPAERLRVEEHLAGCDSCRAELADLQTALRLIRTTHEVEPPVWLATRVMARVRDARRRLANATILSSAAATGILLSMALWNMWGLP